jgi:hypothetical protein
MGTKENNIAKAGRPCSLLFRNIFSWNFD